MNIDAYILAGGRSTRFGSDKALAVIDGMTLAERAYTRISDAFGKENVCFVARDEQSFTAEAKRLDAAVVFDAIEDRGPIGGLYTALTHASTEWIFLFACDLTDVTWSYISALKRKISEKYDAVIPEQPDGKLQPLCAFYNVARTLPIVREMLSEDGKAPAMMSVIDRLETRIAKDNEFVIYPPVRFTNVNYPSDIEK
jgi:molybdopterin-guanine dinucleotide biosynthesis protein A